MGSKSIFPPIGSGRSIEQTFVGKEQVMGRKSIWVGGYLPHRVEILRDGVGEGQGVKIWSGESKKENRFLWRQIVGKNHSSSVVNSITNQFWKLNYESTCHPRSEVGFHLPQNRHHDKTSTRSALVVIRHKQ